MCHFLFDSPEDFLAAFMPHATTLQEDIPNYTDIQPLIQFSDVLLSRTREADTNHYQTQANAFRSLFNEKMKQ